MDYLLLTGLVWKKNTILAYNSRSYTSKRTSWWTVINSKTSVKSYKLVPLAIRRQALSYFILAQLFMVDFYHYFITRCIICSYKSSIVLKHYRTRIYVYTFYNVTKWSEACDYLLLFYAPFSFFVMSYWANKIFVWTFVQSPRSQL